MTPMFDHLKTIPTKRLWLLAVMTSVILSEVIVIGMELLLKGAITIDFLLTGLVTSLIVAGLLAYVLTRYAKTDAKMTRFMEAVAHCSEVIVIADSKLHIEYVNPAFELLFGYSMAEVRGRDVALLLPEGKDGTAHPIERENHIGEKLRRAKDGRNIPVLLKTSPIKDADGGIQGYVGTMTDLTDIKRVLRRLAESEARFQSVIESTPVPLALNDAEGHIIYLNRAFVQTLGYTLRDIPTLAEWWPRAYPDPAYRQSVTATWQQHLQQAREKSEPFKPMEIDIRCKDGVDRAFIVSAAALDDNYSDLHLVILYDITERKHAEINLSESHALLHTIVDNMPIMIFLKRASDLRFELFNRTGADMVGQLQENLLGKTDYDFFTKEQADFFTGKDREVLNQNGIVDILEEPIQTPSGTRILHTKKMALRNENNEPTFLLGIAEDITVRKQIENSLRESEEKLRKLYELSPLGIALTDMNGRFIDFNEAFRHISGYSTEELKELDYWTLTPRKYEADEAKQLESLKQSGRYGPYEKEYRRKDGSLVPLRLNGVMLQTSDGQQYIWSIVEDISERKNAETAIWNQANYDQLTGLPNRRLFTDRLEQEIRKAQRDKHRIAVLFIDLDRFKDINDTLGHDIGDLLLTEAAWRIRHCVRNYDTVARFGGDEFTVMLAELRDDAEISRIAQEVIDRLSAPFVLNERESFVSASIGIAIYPDDATTVSELIRQSDQAMYAAKNAGRRCYRFFTKVMQDNAEMRARLAADLRHALKDEQFEVYYQPIVHLGSGKIHKAEALLRWRHPQYSYVSPASFIPIAEEIGVINDIGDWVFSQAIQKVQQWQQTQGDSFQVSVNKSPVQFINTMPHQNHWIERLGDMGLPGNSIVVEITEGLLMNTDASITNKLLRFRDAGIQVAIDDFGTGYSSLAYLKKFDIDYLKIDQSFTRNLSQDSTDFALCEAIVVMAHRLGLKVIAEGVETEEQRQLLEQIGCDYGQGYLFAKPLPATEFEKLLNQFPSTE